MFNLINQYSYVVFMFLFLLTVCIVLPRFLSYKFIGLILLIIVFSMIFFQYSQRNKIVNTIDTIESFNEIKGDSKPFIIYVYSDL
jgi:hypothetical protein